jgi:hypothetical protein
MAPRHAGMARFGPPVLPLVLATVLLAGCGGSSGVHTQSPTSDAPASTSSSTTPSTSSASGTPSTSPSKPTIPTPTVTAPAQSAVNSYIAFATQSAIAGQDPTHFDEAALNAYLTGKAQTMFDNTFTSMAKAGLAYRGMPANPRVKVATIVSSKLIFLTSCPLADKANPYTQYVVATGKAVPTKKLTPPPPYKLTLTMVQRNGKWLLSDVLQDASKTCAG